MKQILDDIQSGKFAEEWMTENAAGQPHFRELRRQAAHHPIEEVGEAARPDAVDRREPAGRQVEELTGAAPTLPELSPRGCDQAAAWHDA